MEVGREGREREVINKNERPQDLKEKKKNKETKF